MKPNREDVLIERFLSGYEDGLWVDATVTKPDAIDRVNPAIDRLANRKSDGKTLAIEHTIIEPFVCDKQDFAFFSRASFLSIENDESLRVHRRFIQVFVPVGALSNQAEQDRDTIVESVHRWIKSNRLSLPDGDSEHRCPVTPHCELILTVRSVPLESGPSSECGILTVRRQQVESNLPLVAEKVLRDKLLKLVDASADKRILLLERQHMNPDPRRIVEEIERLRPSSRDLARVDEIWIVDTCFYETPFGDDYLDFMLYRNGRIATRFYFRAGKITRFEYS